ncbi:MAG: hypothetical protein ACT4RN_02770 [Pseudonocardia sp.]
MTSDLSRTAPALSRTNKIGLALAALLGLVDVFAVLTPSPGPGAEGPPIEVLVASSVLGVVTLVAVVWAWRTGSRVAARIVAGTRILSGLTALPAFFVEGVPAAFVVWAAATVVLTVVCVGMVLSRPRRA